MKPGSSYVARGWETKKLWSMVRNPELWDNAPATRKHAPHELALRIRAHFGYDWLMMYKRERRRATTQRK